MHATATRDYDTVVGKQKTENLFFRIAGQPRYPTCPKNRSVMRRAFITREIDTARFALPRFHCIHLAAQLLHGELQAANLFALRVDFAVLLLDVALQKRKALLQRELRCGSTGHIAVRRCFRSRT